MFSGEPRQTAMQMVETAPGSPLRFQPRDGEILSRMYECDGVLAKRQIREMFWRGKSVRAMEKRLAKLRDAGYLAWPDHSQWRSWAIPEPVCWLGWRGAIYIAGRAGVEVRPPRKDNENQLRLLQRRLRDEGIRWRREPRWAQIQHDLAVVDFRMAVEASSRCLPRYSVGEWIHEGTFRSQMDVVEYLVESRGGEQRRMRKGVCPDSYFVIIDEALKARGDPHKARFLLEVDMGTHDTSSFGIEKAASGAAYIKSTAYRERFGFNAGRWLVVTSGDVRMNHLIRQTKAKARLDAGLFLFTTLDRLRDSDPVTSPIWESDGRQGACALLGGHE